MEHLKVLKEKYMKAILRILNFMEQEHFIGQMDLFIMALGLIVKEREKEKCIMEKIEILIIMKVIGQKAKKKEMEHLFI